MRNKRKRVSKRASYRLSAKAQNQKKRWHFLYIVYPSVGFPYFPSDEALVAVVRRYRRISFVGCERFPDHDVLIVRGVEDNMFRTIAEPEQKTVRRQFLDEIGALGLPSREIKPIILEELEGLCTVEGFQSIVWDGREIIARTQDDKRLRSHMRGKCYDPFKPLYHLCKTELPFFYEAA